MTKEALKLALAALEIYGKRHRATYLLGGAWDEEITLGDKAITAIKEALAQPERHELQAKGEHSAPCARHCEANAFQIVIKNLKAQLAQPEQAPVTDEIASILACRDMLDAQPVPPQRTEQEPVAHCKVRPLRGDESFPKVEIDWVNQPVPGPLYTAPPQRKPLTDEQIFVIKHNWITTPFANHLDFARAIEAAHGIKGKA